MNSTGASKSAKDVSPGSNEQNEGCQTQVTAVGTGTVLWFISVIMYLTRQYIFAGNSASLTWVRVQQPHEQRYPRL